MIGNQPDANIRKAVFAFLICFISIKMDAQLNESDTLGFQMRAGINGIYQTGNVNLGVLRTRIEFFAKLSSDFKFKTQNNTLYQEFSKRKADNDINSRNYLYYKPERRVYPFIMAYAQTNFRRQIANRFFSGAGVTWQLAQQPKAVFKLSGSMVYEATRFTNDIFNEPYYSGRNVIAIWRPTLYMAGVHKIADEKINIHYNASWQPGIDQVSNQRLQAELGIDCALWKGLALTANYLYINEQIVPEKVLPYDGILTFGIVCQFKKNNR
ncbi:MAG TPA: DUF481 domain-containing protein [Saprospiraceae bacterium]|nr:DUF481 domain-containing protein [Saprospiraceae bacterium]HMP24808.1 DUF481 domain-containing protein [Saprospiraceae bacterium]